MQTAEMPTISLFASSFLSAHDVGVSEQAGVCTGAQGRRADRGASFDHTWLSERSEGHRKSNELQRSACGCLQNGVGEVAVTDAILDAAEGSMAL